MKFRDRFINAFESIFLTLIMVWTVAIAAELLRPDVGHQPTGAVEIHVLAAADDAPPAA